MPQSGVELANSRAANVHLGLVPFVSDASAMTSKTARQSTSLRLPDRRSSKSATYVSTPASAAADGADHHLDSAVHHHHGFGPTLAAKGAVDVETIRTKRMANAGVPIRLPRLSFAL